MNNIELHIQLMKDLLKEVQELRKEITKSNLNTNYDNTLRDELYYEKYLKSKIKKAFEDKYSNINTKDFKEMEIYITVGDKEKKAFTKLKYELQSKVNAKGYLLKYKYLSDYTLNLILINNEPNNIKDEKLKLLDESFKQFINKIPNRSYDKMFSINKLDFRIKYEFKNNALLRNDKEMTINIILDENERFTFTTVLDLKLQQQANDCNAELHFRWLTFEKLEIKYKLKEEV